MVGKTVKWILAIGALVYAGRAVRDAYVGSLTDAPGGIGAEALEGILAQRGVRRDIFARTHSATTPAYLDSGPCCSKCASLPESEGRSL